MATKQTLTALARATVRQYREDFPGDGPDWASGWWTAAYESDCANSPITWDAYLAACKAAWG